MSKDNVLDSLPPEILTAIKGHLQAAEPHLLAAIAMTCEHGGSFLKANLDHGISIVIAGPNATIEDGTESAENS